jgi:hypothetical protein
MYADTSAPEAISHAPLLVNIKTAARMLSISERSVGRLQAAGDLVPVKIGRALRFAVSDLERFVANRRRGDQTARNSID